MRFVQACYSKYMAVRLGLATSLVNNKLGALGEDLDVLAKVGRASCCCVRCH